MVEKWVCDKTKHETLKLNIAGFTLPEMLSYKLFSKPHSLSVETVIHDVTANSQLGISTMQATICLDLVPAVIIVLFMSDMDS